MPQRQARATKKHADGQRSTQELMTLSTTVRQFMSSIAALTLAALCNRFCKLALSPIYGSLPSEDVINSWTAFCVASTSLSRWSNNAPYYWVDFVTFLGYLPPLVLPILARFSSQFGPYWGPKVAHTLTSFPLLFTSLAESLFFCRTAIFQIVRIPAWPKKNTSVPSALLYNGVEAFGIMLLAGVFVVVYLPLEKAVVFLSSYLTAKLIGETLISRYGMQALIAALWAFHARSKWVATLGVLPLLQVFLFNPHIPAAYNTAIVNSTLKTVGWSLVARQESVTGYISVLDNIRDGFRVMRCDHSLLGGDWRNKPEGHPAKVNDPIYSIFVMLEAVRLVESRLGKESTPAGENALVIGLGIGTAPSALIAHGVHTTTVEIDPVVHDFASKHFELPNNHTSIIGDAVKVVSNMQSNRINNQYDYILHDVFTDGAEPIDLFTYEFLTDLSKLLKRDGVIAINYAGDLLLPSAVSVIVTVVSVFGKCRMFREMPKPTPVGDRDFTNLIMFCRKSGGGDFTFRSPVEADFLGSPARRQHLMPVNEMNELEIDDVIKGKGRVLRRGQTDWLKGSQMRSAIGHWYVMRKVLPDIVWENW